MTIVLSVLLRYTDSDYSFGIYNVFLGFHQPVWTQIMCMPTRNMIWIDRYHFCIKQFKVFQENCFVFLWLAMLSTTTFYCQGLATGRWFSWGTSVYFTNNTDHKDITEILLKVALNTTALTLNLIFNPINIIYEIDLYHVHAVYTCTFSPYISHFTTVCVSFNLSWVPVPIGTNQRL